MMCSLDPLHSASYIRVVPLPWDHRRICALPFASMTLPISNVPLLRKRFGDPFQQTLYRCMVFIKSGIFLKK